jgi:hypothetical protein
MPTTKVRRENALIDLFLSAYERNSWADCDQIPMDQIKDGAVEILATRKSDGKTLAIEHTLIEGFLGDREDLHRFESSIVCISEDRSLIVPEKAIYVYIPVGTLQPGYSWASVGAIIRQWLETNRLSLPVGWSFPACAFPSLKGRKDGDLALQVRVEYIPKFEGALRLGRYGDFAGIGRVVDKALRTKVPKLVKTQADMRILLLERDQWQMSEIAICKEIEKRRTSLPDLNQVNEIWFAETVFYETQDVVFFNSYENDDLSHVLAFERGELIQRAENGISLEV